MILTYSHAIPAFTPSRGLNETLRKHETTNEASKLHLYVRDRIKQGLYVVLKNRGKSKRSVEDILKCYCSKKRATCDRAVTE